jgi:transposase
MEHIAIDLGGRESQICVRNEAGEIAREMRLPTERLPTWLRQQPAGRVVMETSAESFWLADEARAAGHQVRVVAASLVRTLGVGARRTKTDQRDARVLSEVSSRIDLPSVHIPAVAARQRKSLCRMREELVEARTKLINCVRGWMRGQAMRVKKRGPASFSMRVREAAGGAPPAYVERVLKVIEELTVQILEAEKELDQLAKQDEVCRRLMSVPGVGPLTSLRFVATVDELGRFSDAHHLEAYVGLVPGESSSSERKQRLSITKAGSPKLRWALVQAAWSARRCRPEDPMVQWSNEVEKRRGRKIATVALARKLVGILYAIWRDGSIYDPRRGAAR